MDQGQGGEDDLLAGGAQRFGQLQPVRQFQFAPLAADGFPQIDDVGAAGGNLLVKLFGVDFRPEIEQWA